MQHLPLYPAVPYAPRACKPTRAFCRGVRGALRARGRRVPSVAGRAGGRTRAPRARWAVAMRRAATLRGRRGRATACAPSICCLEGGVMRSRRAGARMTFAPRRLRVMRASSCLFSRRAACCFAMLLLYFALSSSTYPYFRRLHLLEEERPRRIS